MQHINMPRANSNDESCVLLEWVSQDGQTVRHGDILGYLETSKATIDMMSPGDGIFHHLGEPSKEYETGSCIGYLFADMQEYEAFLREGHPEQTTEESPDVILTQGARELAAEYRLTEAQLRSLGKKMLRKDDILTILHPPLLKDQVSEMSHSSRNQAAIAKRVTLAHQTIPSAFAAIKIYCDEALKVIIDYSQKEEILVGLVEFFVKVLGEMYQEYPSFYQDRETRGKKNFASGKSPGIGVTVDIGSGLYIPVVREAATKSLREIADDLMAFRLKALRRTFSEEDLSGGHLTLSLHTDTDITVAIPIIFPTQSAIVSLCSEQEELYLAINGGVKVRKYCNVGIVYDHRLINGAEAVRFLQKVKQKIESKPC